MNDVSTEYKVPVYLGTCKCGQQNARIIDDGNKEDEKYVRCNRCNYPVKVKYVRDMDLINYSYFLKDVDVTSTYKEYRYKATCDCGNVVARMTRSQSVAGKYRAYCTKCGKSIDLPLVEVRDLKVEREGIA